jgi:prepilin signal peptidase PulO-like enzyme (type II secretory pathway)
MLAFGGCVGSFLNVIIFRWPRDLSIRKPLRSFCPLCGTSIAWYDNIPVISYLLLRGRCRHCKAPISLQYPLVELATAMLFVMTFDILFVAHQRGGIAGLQQDWPMLLGHAVLWAGMIALAVMDLQAYMVDIRVTWNVAAAGILVHTIWTPATSIGPAGYRWIRPETMPAWVTMAMAAGLFIGGWLFLRGPYPEEEEQPAIDESGDGNQTPDTSGTKSTWFWLWLFVPAGLLAFYVVRLAQLSTPTRLIVPAEPQVGWIRLCVCLGAVMLGLTLAASRPEEEVDVEINEAIDAEAPDARRNMLLELKFLSPAIIMGILVVLLLQVDGVWALAGRTLHWRPVGQWQPVWGLATGVAGWVIGGGIGWVTRIIFTMIFGKEAFGMGDVHILAAIGAVAGWPVVLIGFFLAAPLTLAALLVIQLWPQDGRFPYATWAMVAVFAVSLWANHLLFIALASFTLLIILFIQMRRKSRALPYGPWLALGCLIASIYQDQLIIFLQHRGLFGYIVP